MRAVVYVPVILGVVFLQAVYVHSGPPDWVPVEMLDMVKGDKERCMKEHGTTQELIDRVNEGDLVEERSITCYMNCLLDAFSLVDDEGNLEAETLISFLPEKYLEVGTNLLNKCARQGGGDPCEKIFKVAKCVQATEPKLWFMV